MGCRLKIVNFRINYFKRYIMRIVIIVLMLGLTSFCYAQKEESKNSVEEKSIELADELKKELGLSEEQYEKVRLIYVDYTEQKKVLNQEIKQLEKQKKELKNNRNLKINSILTAEQKAKVEKKQNSKRRKKK